MSEPLLPTAQILLDKFKKEYVIKTKDWGRGEWMAVHVLEVDRNKSIMILDVVTYVNLERVEFAPTELEAVRALCKTVGILCEL